MSIYKPNTGYPDILRTLEVNTDAYKLTEVIFITPLDFVFTVEQFADADFWYSELGVNIFPLQAVKEFNPEDEETIRTTSLQDFDYELRPGKYKQKIKFDWSLDYHKLVNQFSGQSLRAIYASRNVLRATQLSGNVMGFKLNTFDLEKLMFTVNSSTGNSNLFLELFDSDELNINGYECEVDWQPRLMNRLVVSVDVLTVTPTFMSFTVKYNNDEITTLTSSDVTIIDDNAGEITGVLLNYLSGAYRADNFSSNITNGCLIVRSTIYIGNERYRIQVSVPVSNSMVFGDGNNMVFGDGNNMVFGN